MGTGFNIQCILPGDKSCDLREIAQYSLRLVDGWSSVQDERDEHNNAGDIAPPFLLQKLVTLRTGFIIDDVLNVYRGHIWLVLECRRRRSNRN